MVGTDQVVIDADNGVGGHREADSSVGSGFGVDGRIHADDFAGHVEQRAAGVAGVDGSIGLDEVLVLTAPGIDGAVLRRDDSGGDGLRKCKRAADGNDPVAHLRAVGIAELYGGQRMVGLDLQHGDVGCLVGADNSGETALHESVVRVGREPDPYLVGLVDHMVIGDDVAAGVNDKSGAERLLLLATCIWAAHSGAASEEVFEEVLEIALALILALVVVVVIAAVVGSSADPARC